MSIREWSKEFASGFGIIDQQHKEIFQLCNTMSDINNDDKQAHINFLDGLIVLFTAHSDTENKLMTDFSFPLAQFHIGEHNAILSEMRQLKQQLIADRLYQPHKRLVAFASGLINNHIGIDDFTFFNFYKNREHALGQHFEGRRCEVLSASNTHIGTGRIAWVKQGEVEITDLSSSNMPVKLNDTVKISSFSEKKEAQTFVAKVYFATDKTVRLFNATIIQARNDRRFVRVVTELNAKMRLGGNTTSYPIAIADLSLGGMMIKTKEVLSEGTDIIIDFDLLDKNLRQRCRVMRASIRNGEPNVYGLQFVSMRIFDSDKVHAYLFNLQTQSRKRSID